MKKAFTLAEVLLIIIIIGIIAIVVFPILSKNYQEKKIKSLLRKSHSVINQALNFYYYDFGMQATGDYFEPRTFKHVFRNHFIILKDYDYKRFYSESNNNNLYKDYTGKSNLYYPIFDDGQFILSDGTLIMIENPNYGKGKNRVFITVDVNGPNRKPNRLGKDLFIFQVDNAGKLLPMGLEGTAYPYSEYCSESLSSNLNGAGCTVKFLEK